MSFLMDLDEAIQMTVNGLPQYLIVNAVLG